LLSKLDKDKQLRLVNRKDKLIEKFAERIECEPEFLKSISQASEKVDHRFKTIENIIDEVINA
jgi:hypothetical protein